MNLPGIITVRPDQPERIERAADILAASFMEECWFITWLAALDRLGTSNERKEEILRAYFHGCVAAHAPYDAVYATDDFAGIAGGMLASEQAGNPTHEQLEVRAARLYLPDVLTEQEAALLDERSRAMEPISDFGWAHDHAAGADHLYFYAWAVDSTQRGSGAFRRLTTPFFDLADERGINCYLECYSDKLQSLYEHFGFQLVDVRSTPEFAVTERCMVRPPQQKQEREPIAQEKGAVTTRGDCALRLGTS